MLCQASDGENIVGHGNVVVIYGVESIETGDNTGVDVLFGPRDKDEEEGDVKAFTL